MATIPVSMEAGSEETVPQSQAEPLILSKTAQKRLAKAQRREETKLERRALEKALKKVKNAEKREKRAREEQEASLLEEDGEPASKKQKLGEESEPKRMIDKTPFHARLVIDLGFDDKMTDREIISLTSQCAYCYSSNKKSPTPFFSLLFSSLNGRTYERLERLKTYQNWRGVEWWDGGYEGLWTSASTEPQVPASGEAGDAQESEQKGESSKSTRSVFKPLSDRSKALKETVVYLTADASDELMELSEGETYIIGGICDKNRYKNLCQGKATSQGIRTARLPIGVYLKSLPTRKVLTVNQVVDILLHWVEKRNWEEAFYAVIPQRKFEAVGKKAILKERAVAKRAAKAAKGDGDEEVEDEGTEDSEPDEKNEV